MVAHAQARRLTPRGSAALRRSLRVGRSDPTRGRPIGAAERRITRQFAIFVSAGYLFYALLVTQNISETFRFMAPWWAAGAPAAVFGSGIMIGIAEFRSRQAMRVTAAVCAALYLAAIVTAFFAWDGGSTSDPRALWLSQFPGLAAITVGIVWPGGWAVAYLAVAAVGVKYSCDMVRPIETRLALVPDIGYAFGYSLPFLVAVMIGVRTARLLDETRSATFDVAAKAAAARARSAERARFDALLHDGAMAVLLGTAQLGVTPTLRDLATRTIASLGGSASTDSQRALGPSDVVSRLRSAITDANDAVLPRTRVDTESSPVAESVVETIASAIGEALRNVDRHAHATEVTVDIDVTDSGIDVAVADNGIGFTISAVPAHRLGIAVSIVGRMRQLPGGDASVDSRPGRGTRVALAWRRSAR